MWSPDPSFPLIYLFLLFPWCPFLSPPFIYPFYSKLAQNSSNIFSSSAVHAGLQLDEVFPTKFRRLDGAWWEFVNLVWQTRLGYRYLPALWPSNGNEQSAPEFLIRAAAPES